MINKCLWLKYGRVYSPYKTYRSLLYAVNRETIYGEECLLIGRNKVNVNL